MKGVLVLTFLSVLAVADPRRRERLSDKLAREIFCKDPTLDLYYRALADPAVLAKIAEEINSPTAGSGKISTHASLPLGTKQFFTVPL